MGWGDNFNALPPIESLVSHEDGSSTFLLYAPRSLASRLGRRCSSQSSQWKVQSHKAANVLCITLTFSVRLLIFVYFKKSLSLLATWLEYVFQVWVQFLANTWCFDKYLAYCAKKGVQVSMWSICCCCCCCRCCCRRRCCRVLNRVQQQQHMLVKLPNIGFHGNALSGSWIVPRRKADGAHGEAGWCFIFFFAIFHFESVKNCYSSVGWFCFKKSSHVLLWL